MHVPHTFASLGPAPVGLACRRRALDAVAVAVANYIAKYATKTLTVPGLPDAITKLNNLPGGTE